jgi:uncharacterized radical SAM superfamily Fe-S cluster-containing enzyme
MEYSGGDEVAEPIVGTLEAPHRKAATYIFHSQTTSLCETCLELVPAKVIIEDDRVFYL